MDPLPFCNGDNNSRAENSELLPTSHFKSSKNGIQHTANDHVFQSSHCLGHNPSIHHPRGVCNNDKEGNDTILCKNCFLHEKGKSKRRKEATGSVMMEEDWHHSESSLEGYKEKENFTKYRLTVTTALAALSAAPVLLLSPSAQPYCEVNLLLLATTYMTAAIVSKMTENWISRLSGHYITFLMALIPILTQMIMIPFPSTNASLLLMMAYIVVGAFLALHEK